MEINGQLRGSGGGVVMEMGRTQRASFGEAGGGRMIGGVMPHTNSRKVLSYRSPDAIVPDGKNWVAVVAFLAALLFNPFLRLAVTPRPFWDGHSLHWIAEIVESIPVLVFPLPGLVLGLW